MSEKFSEVVEQTPSTQLWRALNVIEKTAHQNGMAEHSPYETIMLTTYGRDGRIVTYELGYTYVEKEKLFWPQLKIHEPVTKVYEWYEQKDDDTGLRLELPSQICTEGAGELEAMKDHVIRLQHLLQRDAPETEWRLIEA